MATQRAVIRATTGQFTRALCRVPREDWPDVEMHRLTNPPTELWRSRDYLLMVYEDKGYTRLSILRVVLDPMGHWADGIRWDDLQRLKAECGRGDRWAVEVFPPAALVVNVANMRHMFLLREPPPYGWHGSTEGGC